jgi:hypothetical protein
LEIRILRPITYGSQHPLSQLSLVINTVGREISDVQRRRLKRVLGVLASGLTRYQCHDLVGRDDIPARVRPVRAIVGDQHDELDGPYLVQRYRRGPLDLNEVAVDDGIA